ncbi:hypothetical protein D9758_004197 [Tetrapyrgos nigripes]|uniref:F-box domain-containing protein n=1 Tax=Tetrapyrgos nigripes TaxID=182062 RepID=A0A8H5GUK8_9AGAR|nr:hypothetical protein D9758_004197 [Tetrapyrgos nigripes]
MSVQTESTTLCSKCNATLVTTKRTASVFSSKTLLGSRYTPSNAEVAQTKSLIDDVQQDIERYDEEISSLTQTLSSLKQKRDELAAYKQDHSAFIAPINSLPIEIFTEIFFLCCSTEESFGLSITTENFQNKITTQTLDLAQTCSFWRRAVFQCSRLWSNIRVDIGWRKQSIRPLVEIYLKNSAPIMLVVEANRPDRNTSDREHNYLTELSRPSWKLLEILLETSHRWVHASFDLSWELYVDIGYEIENFNLTEESLRHLRSLVLKWNIGPAMHMIVPSPFFDAFLSASSLSTLHLSCFEPASVPSLDHVTTLRVGTAPLADLAVLFGRTPSLQTFTLDVLPWDDGSDAPEVTELFHDSIETLILGYPDGVPGLDLFQLFHLPRLISLSITAGKAAWLPIDSDYDRKALLKSFTPMLSRSPSLQKLKLDGHMLSRKALVQLLGLTPNLRHLTLITHDQYPHILHTTLFQALHLDFPPPQITSLDYYLSGLDDCDWGYDEADTAPPHIVPLLTSLELQLEEKATWFSPHPRSPPYYPGLPDHGTVASMFGSRRGVLKEVKMHALVRSDLAKEWAKALSPDGEKLRELQSSAGLDYKFTVVEGAPPIPVAVERDSVSMFRLLSPPWE